MRSYATRRELNYPGTEVYFDNNDLIVSKTDLKGHITYANHTFLEIAGYEENEVIGKPHNVIRHENMPRGVFELFWSTIAKGEEIFAYVVNSTKSGDHYWVIAHVTPSFDRNDEVIGYHSNRRLPRPEAIAKIEPLYEALKKEEDQHESRKDGLKAGSDLLEKFIRENGGCYDELVLAL